jgi:hypothetical protein
MAATLSTRRHVAATVAGYDELGRSLPGHYCGGVYTELGVT